MSLFKVLRGDSSRISTEVTPFHDGYAYFTPDDGGFYIDSAVNGTNKRTRINKVTYSIDTVLSASAWSNGMQTISLSDVSVSQDGVISLSQTATDDQNEAAIAAKLSVSSQSDGALVVATGGTVPSVDIPVTILIFN